MRALAFWQHGGPEVLELVDDWPEPHAADGEVIVQVATCGLNQADVFSRRGMPGMPIDLPHISGADVAGRVVALGGGVTELAIGTRVVVDPRIGGSAGSLGYPSQGGLCEFIALPAVNVIPLPDGVSFSDASALPVAYGTAQKMVYDRGKIRPGESVIVLGASGGVGTACVQLAKQVGATVIAVSGSPNKLELLRKLGADEALCAHDSEFAQEAWSLTGRRGADVIIDFTGATSWAGSIRSAAKGGRIIVCGATSGYEAITDLRFVWTRELSILGCSGWTRAGILSLVDLVDRGELTPVIDRIVPLADVAEAYVAMENREIFGKVIAKIADI
jgi:alcohol dehydrogenase